MADDGRPIDDDILAWFAAQRREPERRIGDRRQGDRRGFGFTARRHVEAELNRQLRIFLLDYFRRLSHDDLVRKVDGLWLGRTSNAELANPCEIEFIVAAADRLMVESKWFPKTSEWFSMARTIERERVEAQRDVLQRLPAPLCAACHDTGWANVGPGLTVRGGVAPPTTCACISSKWVD